MPRATYTLELELSYNTWTNVTPDWRTPTPLLIERGIEPGARVASVGRMILTLHNPDGRYTPGHASATPGFEVGIGVRLKASDGVNTYPLFYGRLTEIDPRPNQETGTWPAQPQQTKIVALDDMAALTRARVEAFPLVINATPKDLASRLVDRSFIPPGLMMYWRLGLAAVAALGQTTLLPGDYTGKSLDTGRSLFPWAGDTWRADLPAIRALEDVCGSEGGYFFLRADGTPVLHDRHARPKHISADAELSAALASLRADRREGRITNRVEITVYPRRASDQVEVLWSTANPIRLAPGVPRTVVCRYVDPQQLAARIGAYNVSPPLPGVDFSASTNKDGSGENATGYVAVTAALGAASARLVFASTWPNNNQPLYVQGLQIRGKPLRSFEPVSVTVQDDTSFLAHHLHAMRLDLTLQDDPYVAADMANALLANRKDPHAWIGVEVEATASSGALTQALAREVGDRLSITDAALALDGVACFIEHIQHSIERGGGSHRVIWRTSPADLESYWVLGASTSASLGTASRLGY